ncbi:SDR family oxidoreductase [Chryseobacterium sp. POL2]|uniref:SDR family oxidoreductase n=1 Tax=Chryseobacterium sp. POL2 TaxID=2713414 RepID=UPI0013E1637D|nr:SDR family oxidoreductase [Chryseobacterium sp. POL2]QIG88319.1 SDR family oxidoreductase [Chryseobacterium sp. POL2]
MNEIFSIAGKVAIITGASGVLGGSLAKHFVKQGAKVVAIGRSLEKLQSITTELENVGGDVLAIEANVLDIPSLEAASKKILEKYAKIDILLNIAGGNLPNATLTAEQSFFDMAMEAWDEVTDLNINGSVYPSFVFGKIMANTGSGSIVNVSSMAAYSAITRVAGYSAAKTAITNFTQWLASDVALKFGDKIRVNAIAPGFFIGDQNRKILINEDGTFTDRSKKVIAKTPMGRFGDADELNGSVQFLCSDAASFITGALLPVDGGFSAFSGV